MAPAAAARVGTSGSSASAATSAACMHSRITIGSMQWCTAACRQKPAAWARDHKLGGGGRQMLNKATAAYPAAKPGANTKSQLAFALPQPHAHRLHALVYTHAGHDRIRLKGDLRLHFGVGRTMPPEPMTAPAASGEAAPTSARALTAGSRLAPRLSLATATSVATPLPPSSSSLASGALVSSCMQHSRHQCNCDASHNDRHGHHLCYCGRVGFPTCSLKMLLGEHASKGAAELMA